MRRAPRGKTRTLEHEKVDRGARILCLVSSVWILSACVSPAARNAFERYAESRVGMPASALDARVECSERADGYGCFRTDPRNCKVWFTVDHASDMITAWRYEEPRETVGSIPASSPILHRAPTAVGDRRNSARRTSWRASTGTLGVRIRKGMSHFVRKEIGIRGVLFGGCLCLMLGSCANTQYELNTPPNYDDLIGKKFSKSIFKGRQIYAVVRETGALEELENRRSDGCILVFGVRKSDDVIEYWRVDSGAGSCFTRGRALNR